MQDFLEAEKREEDSSKILQTLTAATTVTLVNVPRYRRSAPSDSLISHMKYS